jgi:glyoxylase-like metal-dependent hydrolase (beta-lactamase superfamily II)
VFNTHVHGDHWLGNHAIRAAYPKVPIYAHRRMIDRVNAGEGEDWLKLFMGMTQGAVAGTRVVGPNIGLQGGEVLTLDGVTLRIHHLGPAHTDHDLLIEVVEDRAIICGDVVVVGHIPNSDVPHDADFGGTIKAIHTLLDGSATTFVPGHGRSGGREVPETALRFLERLQALAKRYYLQGLADYEIKDRVIQDLDEYRNWVNFNELGRVLSYVYLEIERDNF